MPLLTNRLDALSDTQREELERLVAAFEQAWTDGTSPDLEAFLSPAGFLRPYLLPELLHADLEWRLRLGSATSVGVYLRRFPELADDPTVVLELLRAEGELLCQPESIPSASQARTNGSGKEPVTRRLGRFELLGELGRGSSGTVYRARDTELRRVVALKVPRLGTLAGTEDLERFLREARGAAGLRHPGIVALHDAGHVDHLCYLVSELVEGPTLAQTLRAGPLPSRRAAELVAQVADALQHAHESGIIHRDVKPSNILLDQEGRPRLTDFGLARLLAGEQTLTDTGALLGTPAYMSPEQARGEANRVDARADIYSLGVVLYECLTGQRPFQGDGRRLLFQVQEQEPTPPRRLCLGLPRDLETICLKAMSKEPARRYARASELADDLRRFLHGEAVRARPVGLLGRSLRWAWRRPVPAALGAGLVLSVVVGFVLVLDGWRRAETRAVEAREQRRAAEETFRQAHEAVQELARLSGDPRLQGTPLEPLRRQLQGKAVDYFRRFVEQRGSDPSLKHELALAYFQLGYLASVHGGSSSETLTLLEQATKVATEGRQADPDDPRWAMLLVRIHLHAAELHGNRNEAAPWLRELEAARALLDEMHRDRPDDPEVIGSLASVWRGVARCQALHGDPKAASVALHRLRRHCQTMVAQGQELHYWQTVLGDCCRQLAEVEQDARWAEESFAAYRQAATEFDRGNDWDARAAPEATVQNYATLSEALLRLGKPAEALRALDAAAGLAERLVEVPGSTPRARLTAGIVHCGKGRALMELDRYDEALEALARARRRFQEARDLCPDEKSYARNVGSVMHEQGKCYQRTARPAEALRHYHDALAVREQLYAANPGLQQYQLDLGATAYHAAQVLEELDRPEEALREYRRAVTHMRASWDSGARSPRYREWLEQRYRALAAILRQLGRADEADAVEAEREML